MKIIDYTTVPDHEVKKWIDLGWQPYGSPVLSDSSGEIVQAMVEYEEEPAFDPIQNRPKPNPTPRIGGRR